MAEIEREDTTRRRRGLRLRRLIPVAVLAVGLICFFAFDLHELVSFEALREHRESLMAFVTGYGVLAGVAYAALYAVLVAFSVPGGALMTITAGLLFGAVPATIYVVFGATIGATGVFLAARYAFADMLRARAGPALLKMEAGFNEYPLSYLLLLRLVPVFPFWLVNIVPAFLAVGLRTYVVGTFFGIIPGALVYALVGSGAGEVIEAGGAVDPGIIFEWRFIGPILALAVLAILPVVYKKIRSRNRH